jgi:DNA-binding transcriptional ArsR family regulator
MLKAFADPVRLRLLNLLSGEQEEVCVCHLFEALGIPQPTVSRHLAYLRKHRIVVGRKEGSGSTTDWQSPRRGCTASCWVASAPAWVIQRSSAKTRSG